MSHVIVVLFQSLVHIRFGLQLDEGFSRGPTIALEDEVDAVFAALDAAHGEEARQFIGGGGERKSPRADDPLRHLFFLSFSVAS